MINIEETPNVILRDISPMTQAMLAEERGVENRDTLKHSRRLAMERDR